MTVRRPDEVARDWIGTPYVHQASAKGAGCDCLGLLVGVWRELIGELPEAIPPYSSDWSEPQQDEVLWRAAARWLRPSNSSVLSPGQVVLFRMRDGFVAKHLGIVGAGDLGATIIHSYSGHGVVESPLSEWWRGRIIAAFDFPTRSQ